MSCFNNNSNNTLASALHTSCCNNLHVSLAYIGLLLIHAKANILVFLQAITQGCRLLPSCSTVLGLQSFSCIIQPTEDGRLCTCSLTTWPSSVTHLSYLHCSGGHSVMWPCLEHKELGTMVPGWSATSQQQLHTMEGRWMLTGLHHKQRAFIQHLLFARQCAKYYFM